MYEEGRVSNLQEQIFMFLLMDLVEQDLLTTDEANMTKKIYFASENRDLIISTLDDRSEAA
jgi:hypothetical protein